MSRPPSLCIYCGKAGRSKEHIWGKWLAKQLPESPYKHTTHMVIKHQVAGIRGMPGALNRQGSPRRQQIKAPCEKCNNGWMRLMNEAASAPIIRLIGAGPGRLTEAERVAVSAWAVMVSMTSEWAAKDLVVTSQVEREYLLVNKQPPPRWAVLIGLYGGGHRVEAANHRAMVYDPLPGEAAPNAQCNIFTLGRLVCVTLSGAIACEPELAEFAAFHGLRAIWPLNAQSFQLGWTPIHDDRWDAIARYADPDTSSFEMFEAFRQMQWERNSRKKSSDN